MLSKSCNWSWQPSKSKAFDLVKEELAKRTTSALYDPAAITKVSADTSAYSLGAVLHVLQKIDSHWKPVVYPSCSMSETE